MSDVDVWRIISGKLTNGKEEIPVAEVNPEKRFVAAMHYEILTDKLNWQPIETPPREKGYYLAVVDRKTGIVYFNGTEFPYHVPGEITHWMPLPPPPNVKGEKRE